MQYKRFLLSSLLVLFFIRPTLPATYHLASGQVALEGREAGSRISPDPEDESRRRLEKEMAKKANLERQEKLKKDTDKLFALATELKQYVDKSNENTLSLDVIKKAEEIEKLSRSVKDKMKAGY